VESQFRWYLTANAAWFASFGVQMTLFPWLVAVALREPASRVGIAWTAMMAPAIVFMLLGGVPAAAMTIVLAFLVVRSGLWRHATAASRRPA